MSDLPLESLPQTVSHAHPVPRPPDRHPWYAVRVRSNYERTTSTILRGRGYETFPALYRTKRRWSDRLKDVEAPLFPGYIFCRFDPVQRVPIISTPGVVHIVGVGNAPEVVDETEVTAIQALIGSKLPVQPWPFLRVGQRVMVQYGSLTGLEGIVINFKNQLRLVLSVTLLQRSVAVEIDRHWIRPV